MHVASEGGLYARLLLLKEPQRLLEEDRRCTYHLSVPSLLICCSSYFF